MRTAVIEVVTDKPKMMPVIVDEDTNAQTAALVVSNKLLIIDLSIKFLLRHINVEIAFGGYDSRGKWHADVKQQTAKLSISGARPEQEKIYRLLAEDEFGNPKLPDTDFLARLIEADFLKLANERVWGIEHGEIRVDDQAVHSFGKYAKKKAGDAK